MALYCEHGLQAIRVCKFREIDMIEENEYGDVLNFSEAEPGEVFGVVFGDFYPDGTGYHNNKFVSLTVQRNLKRDVVCLTENGEEMRFDKNLDVHNAYLLRNEKFIALKNLQENIDKATAVIEKIRLNGFDMNASEDIRFIQMLIDFGDKKKGTKYGANWI